MKLNERHKKFCEIYVETLNGTRSYMEAYGAKYTTAGANAEKLLKKPEICLYIEELMNSKRNDRIMSHDRVLELLTLEAEGLREEEVVVGYPSKCKHEIVKKKIGARERIRALELIGKRYMMFTDKVQVEADVNVTEYSAEWTED